ncbi:tetratricopeptide repeat protein [Kangiella sp. TOML190]|uniref:tetratricopeptide repeat protein n=1 Tax=Kangiella sp. TOML190 TaxID=2931351 RepID=UPI00203EAC9A|nr:hypothetical protein [Kangiella sp. TOML190]
MFKWTKNRKVLKVLDEAKEAIENKRFLNAESILKSNQQFNDTRIYRMLGHLYLEKDNKDWKQDIDLSFEYFFKAMELGDVYSIFEVSKQFLAGELIEQNFEAAFELLIQVEDCSLADVHYCLAGMYSEGLGTQVNEAKAMEHFNKAKRLDSTIYNKYMESPSLYTIDSLLKNKS